MRHLSIAFAIISIASCGPLDAQSIRNGKTAGGIAYDVQGSGPPIVLLTGSNLDRRMWAREAGWL